MITLAFYTLHENFVTQHEFSAEEIFHLIWIMNKKLFTNAPQTKKTPDIATAAELWGYLLKVIWRNLIVL